MPRPIVQMGRDRMPVLKDTKTAVEVGYPYFQTLASWGVLHRRTSHPIIAGMAKFMTEILSKSAVATNLKKIQQMQLLADGKDFAAFFAK